MKHGVIMKSSQIYKNDVTNCKSRVYQLFPHFARPYCTLLVAAVRIIHELCKGLDKDPVVFEKLNRFGFN